MFVIITQASAPSDGDYNGADTGSFVIDSTACVVYENVGTADATVWTVEGAEP